MSNRKTLKVKPTTKERFDALDDLANREQYPDAPRCTDCGSVAHVWTVEDGMLLCGSCV